MRHPVCPSACESFSESVGLSVCLSVCLFVCVSIHPYACLPKAVCVCLSLFCLSLCPEVLKSFSDPLRPALLVCSSLALCYAFQTTLLRSRWQLVSPMSPKSESRVSLTSLPIALAPAWHPRTPAGLCARCPTKCPERVLSYRSLETGPVWKHHDWLGFSEVRHRVVDRLARFSWKASPEGKRPWISHNFTEASCCNTSCARSSLVFFREMPEGKAHASPWLQ